MKIEVPENNKNDFDERISQIEFMINGGFKKNATYSMLIN